MRWELMRWENRDAAVASLVRLTTSVTPSSRGRRGTRCFILASSLPRLLHRRRVSHGPLGVEHEVSCAAAHGSLVAHHGSLVDTNHLVVIVDDCAVFAPQERPAVAHQRAAAPILLNLPTARREPSQSSSTMPCGTHR